MSGKIKLNAASGGGSVSIQAPSSESNNRTLTLPSDADGTIVSKDTTNNLANIASINDGSIGTKNLIINGGMQVYQRGSTFTMSGTDNQKYTVDQFQHNVTSGASFASTDSVSSDHPDGFTRSLKISPTATDTPTGSGNAGYRQKIEGGDLQHLAFGTSSAKTITLSFYAKSGTQNNGHQYGIQLRSFASSGSSSDRRTVTAPFTVTSNWQRFTFTFAGNTSTDIVNNTTNGLEVNWHLAAGSDDILSAYTTWTADTAFRTVTGQSNFLDNTNNEFYLTGVQLEVGSTASAFVHESYADTFLKCQRYYHVIFDGSIHKFTYWQMAYYYNSGTMQFILRMNPEMRATPTLECTSTSGVYRLYRNGAYDSVDDFLLSHSSKNSCRIYNASDASGTAGQIGGLYVSSDGGGNEMIALTAEL